MWHPKGFFCPYAETHKGIYRYNHTKEVFPVQKKQNYYRKLETLTIYRTLQESIF